MWKNFTENEMKIAWKSCLCFNICVENWSNYKIIEISTLNPENPSMATDQKTQCLVSPSCDPNFFSRKIRENGQIFFFFGHRCIFHEKFDGGVKLQVYSQQRSPITYFVLVWFRHIYWLDLVSWIRIWHLNCNMTPW